MSTQPLREQPVPPGIQGGTEVREGRADLRGVRHVDDIRCHEEPQTDAEASALRRCEGGSRKRRYLLQQRCDAPVEVSPGVVVPGIDTGDVAPCAERPALPTQQQGTHRPFGGVVESSRQIVQRAVVERIQLVGCVEHDLDHAVIDLEADHAVSSTCRHVSVPRRRSRR